MIMMQRRRMMMSCMHFIQAPMELTQHAKAHTYRSVFPYSDIVPLFFTVASKVRNLKLLLRVLYTLSVVVCCTAETRIKDLRIVVALTTLGTPGSSRSRPSSDSGAGRAGVGIHFHSRVEASLLDWISVDNRLCAVRLSTWIKTYSSKH
ncbi:polyprotein [Clonorchis sinensis]|uniref:Polyprotein n=1 Tax=Clonorchis sinensis TaxID=79923 RepID=G7Y519_CLOSI|nr:polyprotein [Clonorchis sinensis]